MTVNELENGLMDLRRRLSSVHEIVRRSILWDPTVSSFLLSMNLQFRHQSQCMAAALKEARLNHAPHLLEDLTIDDPSDLLTG